jgi:subtilase family serine protease
MDTKNTMTIIRFILFISVLSSCLCTLPEDPNSPSNTSVSIIMRSSRWNVESAILKDTAGNIIEIGAALFLPENIDSISLEVRKEDTLVFDTVFTSFTSDPRDTAWSKLVFYTAGERTVTITPFSSIDLPTVTATIKITGRKFPDNNAPVVTVSGDRIVVPGTICTLTVTGTDIDKDQLVAIRLDKSPGNAELNDDSLFIWEISEDGIGYDTVIFIGTDNGAPPQSDTETVIFTVTDAPHLPVLTIEGTTRIAPNEVCTLHISIADDDKDQEHVLAMTNEPDGAELIGDSLFIWQAPETFHGAVTVIFTATDNGTPPLSSSLPVTVSVSRPENHAPTWTSDTLPISINESARYQLQLEPLCSDIDEDSLTFTLLDGAPDQDQIDNSTYSLQAHASLIGTYLIAIVVSDQDAEHDTLVLKLSIAPSSAENDSTAPAITILQPGSDSLITGDDSFRIDLICTDASGIASLTAKFADTVQSFKYRDAYYSTTITAIPSDDYLPVTITAVDSSDRKNRSSLTVYLRYDPTMKDSTGPAITLVSPEEDSALVNSSSATLSVSATDENGISSLIALLGDTELDVTSEDGVYSVTVDDLPTDEYTTVMFIATDDSYNGNSETLAVSVRYRPLYPDLEVAAIDVDPEAVLTGDSVLITVTLHNSGDASAPASHASVTIGDDDPQTFEVPELAVDSTSELQLRQLFSTEQTVTITARADADNEVEESDEENNSRQRELSVTEKPVPNLVIRSLATTPETPATSDSVTITVTVRNSGNATADASVLSIDVGDGSDPSLHDVPALDADSTHTITRTVLFETSGNYTITATADWENVVTESAETDNEKQITVTVTQAPQPNLVIKDFSITPQQPDNESSITFSVTVANSGEATATASQVSIKLGGEASPVTFDVPSLAAGEEHTVTRDSLFSVVGDYLATAVADAGNAVEESNENDNREQITVAVVQAPQPDLTIASVSVSPETPTVDDPVTLTIQVENSGDGNADASVLELTIGSSDPVLIDLPALDAGSSFSATFDTLLTTPQQYTVTVTADQGDAVEESDETNNTGDLTFAVTQADLVIGTFTFSPSSPTTGDTITFSTTVKNTGEGTAHASRLAIKVGGGSPVLFTVPALLPGATSTAITRKVFLGTAGSYSATAVADSGNAVTESSESNNTASRTFTVALRQIAAYPLKYDADDSLGRYGPMTLAGAPFAVGGIICNGIYTGGVDPNPCNATTPNITTLDFTSFAIVAEFKIDSFPTENIPVFFGGTSYRWMGFILSPDSTISLRYNNGSTKTSTVKYTAGEWHEAKITYNGTIGACYLDGVLVTSQAFTLVHGSNPNISITDFSLGSTFRGTFRNLKVYDAASGGAVIAHYPLMQDANEVSGRFAAMTLINTPFVTSEKGIICNGNYATETAITPALTDFDFSDFSITFNFYLPSLPGARMPVIVGGRLYRWLGFMVEPTGSVTLMHTNGTYVPGTRTCTVNRWYKGEIRYNAATQVGQVFLNGVLSASATFALDHGDANQISVSHYGLGTAFAGILADLKIYSK